MQQFIPLIIFILIGSAAILYIKVLLAKREFIRDENQPETTHHSRIVKKQRRIGYSVENKVQKVEIALITFEKLQDGKKIEICVPNEDYEKLAEGDVVNLTIKGNRYVNISDVTSMDEVT